MNISNRKSFCALLFLCALFFLFQAKIIIPETQEEKIPITVTVFVHGIIGIRPHLSITNVIKLMQDNITNSVYARTVEVVRRDPFFHQYHAMQGLGMQIIDMNDYRAGAASPLFARTFHTVSLLNNRNLLADYYTYGWSGLLSQRMRFLEAKMFYAGLKNLHKEYTQKGYNPRFVVVAYSHGGNVALKLGEIADSENHNGFTIDLVLIGVPVLPDAASLIQSSLFANIWHFYSPDDRIQPLDCFALNRFFSDRTFYPLKHATLPQHLTQIKLQIKRPTIHYCLKHKQFCFDKILKKNMLRNANPGHTELWSFGWVPTSYRPNFPLFPLPAASIIPYIMAMVENHQLRADHITVDVHPYSNRMIVQSKQKKCELPFIDNMVLDDLRAEALKYKPQLYSPEAFIDKIQEAMCIAQNEKQEEGQKIRFHKCIRPGKHATTRSVPAAIIE